MLNKIFIYRELRYGGWQAFIFVLCVALSLVSLIVVNSFRRDIASAVVGDARVLHGADIIISSSYPFSPSLNKRLVTLQAEGVAVSNGWEFYSVARNDKETLLSNIKVVEGNYPLYGEIQLQSGEPLEKILQPGSVVVAKGVAERMHLAVGDKIEVGEAQLILADIIKYDPSRPVDIFSLGPRIFASQADLDNMNVLGQSSRVKYLSLLKLDSKNVSTVEKTLKELVETSGEKVESALTARSAVKRFFDNLFFFLALISIFTLMLSGIGMQNGLSALLTKQKQSQAVCCSLGATSRFVISHYLVIVLLLGFAGAVFGVVGAFFVTKSMGYVFAGLLPPGSITHLAFVDIVEGCLIGLAVVLFFSFLPLYRLRLVKPGMIFRASGTAAKHDLVFWLLITFGVIGFSLLVIRQLDDVQIGLYFMAALVLLIAFISVVVRGTLWGIAKLNFNSLSLRLAERSLVRPGNGTIAIGTTLGAALVLLLTIHLVEYNLRASYIESYPEDAPNLFFLDIQKTQQKGFSDIVDPVAESSLYPVIRSRLLAINDKAINLAKENERRSDSLSREFNLTYRNELLDDELIIAGQSIYGSDKSNSGKKIPVSILDTVAQMGSIGVGDELQFNIQGIRLKATVTSIRTQTSSKLSPFFYFVFPPRYLESAPQTFFAAVRVSESKMAETVRLVSEKYPNISTINVTETAKSVGNILEKLIRVIRFFAAFSMFAGGLIIVSSIFATRLSRVREAVYYKILGATTTFVQKVFLYENIMLGFLGIIPAIVISQFVTWLICDYIEIVFRPYLSMTLLLCMLTGLGVIVTGWLSGLSIISEKPGRFLREEAVD